MEKFYDALKQIKEMQIPLSSSSTKEEKERFCSALQDLAPDYVPECKWLKRILEDDFHLEFINKEDSIFSEKKQIVGRIKKRLEIEEGFGEQAVEKMVLSLIVIGEWGENYRDGVLYEVTKQDNFYEMYKKSISIQPLQESANLGNPKAQYELGRLYYDGVLEQNKEMAFQWWRRAMEGDKEDILKDKVGLEYIRKSQEFEQVKKEYLKKSQELEQIKKEFEDFKQKQGITQHTKQSQNAKGKATEKKKFRQVQIGDRIRFGKNDKEWIVLDKQGEKGLIITKDSIGKKKYNEEGEHITWAKCSLRVWLNGEFLQKNFSMEERNKIEVTSVRSSDNPTYRTWDGRVTRDRVFCLSIEEANRYFKDNLARAIGSWWLLRSPGHNSKYVAGVSSDGSIDDIGSMVEDNWNVRPALWINLNGMDPA